MTLPDPDDRATVRTTGVGSLPGTDPAQAARIAAGEFDVPFLAELPARGPGADLLGRTLALVASSTGEFGAETTPTGWRLAGGRSGAAPGLQMRRAAVWLGEDADRFEEALLGFTGLVKVQVAGPWTLAAGVEAVHGTRLLADQAACADLGVALGEALGGLVAQLRRRVPGATVVAQLDEPTLPAVLAGRIRTPSGRGAVRVPEAPEVVDVLAGVLSAAQGAGAAERLVHCCAADPPFDVLARAGSTGVSVDASALATAAEEALGSWWDRGGLVVLGSVPAVDPHPGSEPRLPEATAREVSALWRRLGFPASDVVGRTWLSPACGLAGASPGWSRAVGAVLRSAARMLDSAE